MSTTKLADSMWTWMYPTKSPQSLLQNIVLGDSGYTTYIKKHATDRWGSYALLTSKRDFRTAGEPTPLELKTCGHAGVTHFKQASSPYPMQPSYSWYWCNSEKPRFFSSTYSPSQPGSFSSTPPFIFPLFRSYHCAGSYLSPAEIQHVFSTFQRCMSKTAGFSLANVGAFSVFP